MCTQEGEQCEAERRRRAVKASVSKQAAIPAFAGPGAGVFLTISRANHSCRPTCAFVLGEDTDKS